jgi:hypothetical protein
VRMNIIRFFIIFSLKPVSKCRFGNEPLILSQEVAIPNAYFETGSFKLLIDRYIVPVTCKKAMQ